MIALHELIARALVLYLALIGIWGIVLFLRRAPLDGAFQGALIIAVVLAVIQALLGVLLLLTGTRPRDDLHYLYGLSLIVSFPLVQQYASNRPTFPRALAYGLASLFMMGLGIRAITTGN